MAVQQGDGGIIDGSLETPFTTDPPIFDFDWPIILKELTIKSISNKNLDKVI